MSVQSELKGKHRRFLRGLGVGMKPTVVVGKEGLSESVLTAVRSAIRTHELIKVRLLESVEGPRKEVARELAEQVGAELIQVLGRTLLLYRRNEEEPRIELPA